MEKKIKYFIQDIFKSEFKILVSTKFLKLYLTNNFFLGSYTFIIFPFVEKINLDFIHIGKKIGNFIKKKSDIVYDFNIIKGFLNLIIKNKYWINSLNSILINNTINPFIDTFNKKKYW